MGSRAYIVGRAMCAERESEREREKAGARTSAASGNAGRNAAGPGLPWVRATCERGVIWVVIRRKRRFTRAAAEKTVENGD